jgi:topoisomerase-4 subunit B
VDEINNKNIEFVSENGIAEYVQFINEGRTTLNTVAYFSGKNEDINVEIALQFVSDASEVVVSFANSVKTRNGGTHESAFKTSLTECINNAARKFGLLKDKDKNFEGEDVREGLSAVISLRIPEKLIQYKGQTKDELGTAEAATAVKTVFKEKFTY